MLFPDVWDFEAPSETVNSFNGSTDKEFSTLCKDLIQDHHLNHSVSVVIPGSLNRVKELTNFLTVDCDYYKAILPLSQFVDKQFIDLFVRKGELSALSIGTWIDVDDCAAVVPSGHLILSVCRDTFHKLGLEGRPWPKSLLVKPEKYAVCIDLRKDYFKPGKPNYERVLKSFSEFLPLHFEFIFAWEPHEKDICPSSIASFLHKKGHDVRVCSPKFSYKVEHKVRVPSIEEACPNELLEWLGAFSLGLLNNDCNMDDDIKKDYLSSYKLPMESIKTESVARLQWTGFFTTKKVQNLFSYLKNYVKSPVGNTQWTSLSVHGFSDSPLSWGLHQHTFYTTGHNSYTLFLQPDGKFRAFKVAPSNKRLKRKK